MAKWDVIFTHRDSSRTFKRTVDASCQTQAVIAAQAEFTDPAQWAPVVAGPVPAGYYDRIARFAAEQDRMIDDREDLLDRERERFAAFNEE